MLCAVQNWAPNDIVQAAMKQVFIMKAGLTGVLEMLDTYFRKDKNTCWIHNG